MEDFDFGNILLNEKSYENILVYDILYKKLIGAKPFCVRFDKINEFIRVYDGSRYLLLFEPAKYDAIYDRIRYLITYGFFYNYAKIRWWFASRRNIYVYI